MLSHPKMNSAPSCRREVSLSMPRFTIHDLAATIDARAGSGGEASYTRKLLDKTCAHSATKFGAKLL